MRIQFVKTLFIFGLLSLGSCASDSFLQDTLDSNIAFWNDKGVTNYIYTYNRTCECTLQEDTRITVTNGVVSQANFIPSGTEITGADLDALFTVEDLFALIQEALDEKAFQIEIIYNQEFGYPESIYIDSNASIADDEIFYTATDFVN